MAFSLFMEERLRCCGFRRERKKRREDGENQHFCSPFLWWLFYWTISLRKDESWKLNRKPYQGKYTQYNSKFCSYDYVWDVMESAKYRIFNPPPHKKKMKKRKKLEETTVSNKVTWHVQYQLVKKVSPVIVTYCTRSSMRVKIECVSLFFSQSDSVGRE